MIQTHHYDAARRKFTAKERDSESGLGNFGARYNSSSLGRFMSVDPKHVNAHLSDPQSFNRYAYARNNPLLYVDPDGRDFEKALQDLKTFVGSFYVRLSGGVGLEARGKLGPLHGTVGAAAKINAETSLSKQSPIVTISRSAEVGASVETGGFKKGESIQAEQKLITVNNDRSVDTRPDVPKVDIVDSLGGHTTVNSSSDQVGVGVEVGLGLAVGAEVGFKGEGVSALKDLPGELKDSLKNPGPPPTPPPPPCSGNTEKCPN